MFAGANECPFPNPEIWCWLSEIWRDQKPLQPMDRTNKKPDRNFKSGIFACETKARYQEIFTQ
jgi:hypothetical protein